MKEVIIMKNEASQEFKTIFSERLGSAMNSRNCTQEQLAQAIGTKQTTVFRWLSGEYCPNFEMVTKCAMYLDVKIDYLAGLENDSQTYTNKDLSKKTGLSASAIHNLTVYNECSFGLSELLENDWWGLVVLNELSEYYNFHPDKNGYVIYHGVNMPLNYAKKCIVQTITEALLKTREELDETRDRLRLEKEVKQFLNETKKGGQYAKHPKKK